MKFKFACADFAFPALSLEKALSLIALLEIPGVDIGLFESRGSLWPSKELRNPSKSGAALRKKLDRAGVRLADMFLIAATDFPSRAVNHPDPKVRRELRSQFLRLLEYTAEAGGKHATGLPGVSWPGVSHGEVLARSAEELSWRVDEARKAGIIFSVEPHLGSLISKPAQTMRLLEMTPGLTLTLDYSHFIYQGIPNEEIHPLVRSASHFHARCGGRKRLQAPLKRNTVDFAAILKAMKRTGYTGWLGLEYVWIDWEHCNEVDNLTETLLLRKYLEGIAAGLKG